MIPQEANELLDRFLKGQVNRKEVLRAFQAAPVKDLGFATVDSQRALRKGFPEVVFGSGKTPEQVVAIANAVWTPAAVAAYAAASQTPSPTIQ